MTRPARRPWHIPEAVAFGALLTACSVVSGGASSSLHDQSLREDGGTSDASPSCCSDAGSEPPEQVGPDFDFRTMLLPALPEPRGNAYGDNESAAQLGYQLFFDIGALSDNGIRCASCHVPEHGFATNIALPIGVDTLPRNAMTLTNAARSYPHFWDGRADSLWAQALSAIENPAELNGNRVDAVKRVAASYATLYAATFGPVPDFTDAARFPDGAAPGSAAWEAMSAADRELVTTTFVNVGKAIAAYVRKLARGRSAFDRFVEGDVAALSEAEQHGKDLFVQAGCVRCHSGPNFSDGRYHRLDIPLPSNPRLNALAAADRGRGQGLEKLLASEFNSTSVYFDRPAGEAPKLESDVTPTPDGYFLTPSLRNVSDTGPYSHLGAFADLEGIVRFHLGGGGPNCQELVVQNLSDDEVSDLVAFLRALKGEPAPAPWSEWPKASGYVAP